MYARPANSGPGRVFMMGLPYILGDKDPKDPKDGWDKTWAYLKELGQNVEYYPGGTAQVMKELGEGTRDIVVSTTGWDINPRVLGTVPKEGAATFCDAYMIPAEAPSPDTAYAFINEAFTPQAQAAEAAYLVQACVVPEALDLMEDMQQDGEELLCRFRGQAYLVK